MFIFLAELFAILWVFLLGAAIGSFLNVVIYRLPRGKTLFGRSQCPYCHANIAMYDNIPVFSWFCLRGRCRTCRLGIAARYPIVEFIVGTIFLLVAVATIGLGGATIPGVEVPRYSGLAWQLFEPRDEIMWMFVCQSLLLTGLFAIALLRLDGQSIPISIAGFVIAGGFVAGLGAPALPEVSLGTLGEIGSGFPMNRPFLGLAVGVLYGFTLELALVATSRELRPVRFLAIVVWGVTGWAIGYDAINSVTLIATVVFIARRSTSLRTPQLNDFSEGVLLLAWILNIVGWLLLAQIPGWPSPVVAWYTSAMWFAGNLALLSFVRWRACLGD